MEPTPSPDLKSCDFETIAGTLEESVSDVSEGQKKIEVALDEGRMKLALNAKRAEVLAQKHALESELNFSEETTKSTSGDFSVFSTGAGPPPNGSGMQCRWRVNVVEALENAKMATGCHAHVLHSRSSGEKCSTVDKTLSLRP